MKKLFMFVALIALTITLTGCQVEPYVVEIEKEVVVIQTETEVITVETQIVIPSVNEFGFKDPDNTANMVQFFFNRNNEVYTLISEYHDPLISDSYYVAIGISYYSNGAYINSFLFSEEDKIFGFDTHEEYIASILLQADYVSIKETYEQLEESDSTEGE